MRGGILTLLRTMRKDEHRACRSGAPGTQQQLGGGRVELAALLDGGQPPALAAFRAGAPPFKKPWAPSSASTAPRRGPGN